MKIEVPSKIEIRNMVVEEVARQAYEAERRLKEHVERLLLVEPPQGTPRKELADEDSLDELDIPTRSITALHRIGITDIKTLCSIGEYDLRRIRGLGRKGAMEILARVKYHGRSFQNESILGETWGVLNEQHIESIKAAQNALIT